MLRSSLESSCGSLCQDIRQIDEYDTYMVFELIIKYRKVLIVKSEKAFFPKRGSANSSVHVHGAGNRLSAETC